MALMRAELRETRGLGQRRRKRLRGSWQRGAGMGAAVHTGPSGAGRGPEGRPGAEDEGPGLLSQPGGAVRGLVAAQKGSA